MPKILLAQRRPLEAPNQTPMVSQTQLLYPATLRMLLPYHHVPITRSFLCPTLSHLNGAPGV